MASEPVYTDGTSLTSQSYAGSLGLDKVGTYVSLTWASTVNIDASLGNRFKVTLAGNTAFTVSNLMAGQRIELKVIIGGLGLFTCTWSSTFRGSTTLGLPTLALSVTGSKNKLWMEYDSDDSKLDLRRVNLAYS